ncbi:MAG: hypothetical protein MJ231_03970 [bacterium]|nr:hypothetical protein [bacterium]
MNIIIIGTGIKEQLMLGLCYKSELLEKIYTVSHEPLEDIPNVDYKNYRDLLQKIKLLQVDIALILDKKYIDDGLVEMLKRNRINVICVNRKWLNLEKSRLVGKQLSVHYSINVPQNIKAPTHFPVVLKSDNSFISEKVFANSIEELIDKRKEFSAIDPSSKVFIEEYIDGDEYSLVSLWDGAGMYYFPALSDTRIGLSEVQMDRLDLLKTKLNFMFSDEKADFIGFVVTKLLWAKNDWYVLEYKMTLDDIDVKNIITTLKSDFLQLLRSAIYQKLGNSEVSR